MVWWTLTSISITDECKNGFYTLARSRSACLRCLQKRTDDSEWGLVTGSPYTSRRIKTPATRTPFISHTRRVGNIQSIHPQDSATHIKRRSAFRQGWDATLNISCLSQAKTQVLAPASGTASILLPVCPETVVPELLQPPHSRDANGLKERKSRVKAHRAMRERSSIPPALSTTG